jgi:hypothetical protein
MASERQLNDLRRELASVRGELVNEIAKTTELRAELAELKSVPVLETPPPRCPHNRVEMLAHQDDIPPDGPCLMWSPICRDCGDDVPMAAPPVGTQE